MKTKTLHERFGTAMAIFTVISEDVQGYSK
jgi:hypothetical protein